MNPKPGDIGLVRIRGEAGRLIRVGQWLNGDGYADYEHAYVLVDNHHIVEAQPGGAVCVPQRHSWTETRWLSCPPEHARFVARAAMGLVGTPYSALDYFAIAAHRLDIPSRALDRYVSDSHHMICSQLADESAMRGGWHLFGDGRIPQDVTPGDLYQLWEKQQKTRPGS